MNKKNKTDIDETLAFKVDTKFSTTDSMNLLEIKSGLDKYKESISTLGNMGIKLTLSYEESETNITYRIYSDAENSNSKLVSNGIPTNQVLMTFNEERLGVREDRLKRWSKLKDYLL
jgi:hypothetical protein